MNRKEAIRALRDGYAIKHTLLVGSISLKDGVIKNSHAGTTESLSGFLLSHRGEKWKNGWLKVERPQIKDNKEEQSKICKCCGRSLPLSEFYINNASKDHHNHKCKECCKKDRVIKKNNRPLVIKQNDKVVAKIFDFTDDALFAELRKRGYTGELKLVTSISI